MASEGLSIMNLIMLDIDGTLTQSYDYDREIFGLAIAEVLGCPPVDADLINYVDKTSIGVTLEAIQRITGRRAGAGEIEKVKSGVLQRLQNMYRESPQIFSPVPGAALLLERLRKFEQAALAIATGCWRSEALFKLGASGLNVDGIPIATSDDDRNRQRIMEIAAGRAMEFYACPAFERIVYLGDGPWDLQFSHLLGYGFIGIGHRVQALMQPGTRAWHPDYLEIETVLTSIAEALKP
jgi:phosphoglycolate phosphatase-like HAD superfamily hydrolase